MQDNQQLDSKETLEQHSVLIKRKGFLKKLYEDFYKQFMINDIPPGDIVELGSGGGFIKEIIANAITSDVVGGPGIDMVFSATDMPFQNSSVSAFVMIDVLHHIKDPEKALREMERCLKPGGKIIMIEPYNSSWGRFIYQNFHHERFDPTSSWEIKGEGRLSDANGAIPWIIFVRDRKIFEEKFSELKIIKIQPHTPIAYLISGGLSKPQFLPSFMYQFVRLIEKAFSPFNRLLGMFVTITLIRPNK